MKRGVEVADLPRLGAGIRLLRLLDERAHGGLRAVDEVEERAGPRPVGRDRRLREPAAVHVPVEVVLHAHGRVERIDVEPAGSAPTAGSTDA